MHSDRKKLWEPSNEWINGAEVTRFVDFVNKKFNQKINGGIELYRWSVKNIPDFWEGMWEFGGIISSQTYSSVVDDLKKFPGCKFFPGAKLNFAENLLKFKDEQLAFLFQGETKVSKQMTYAKLRSKTIKEIIFREIN